jgi:hypothetical protein
MKDQILKIAKVKDEKSFYKKYPTEEAFMAKHGKALKKAAMGSKMVQTQLKQLTDFGNPPIAQNGAGIIPFEDARNKAQATILGITPEELMKRRDAEAAQANQSSGGGANDIMSQLASFITPEMMAGLAAKDGYSLSKAYDGEVVGGIPQRLITGNTSPAWTNYSNPLGATTAPMAIPGNTTANSYKVDYSAGKSTAQAVGKTAPKAGLDFKGAGMSALSALPQLIGDVQAIAERKKQKKELRKGVDVSDLVRRAAESRPIYQPNQQIVKPWDVPIQRGELYNSYGSNTNFLSAANGTQIQNTYAPTNTLYDDLGYEPLNESNVKQYQNGGRAKRAQFGLDMLAAPAGSLGSGLGSSLAGGGFKGSPEGNIGSTVGSIAGQLLIPIPGVGAIIGGALGGAIGGFIGGDEQRQMEELQNQYSNNTDLAAGQSVIQSMDQQFGGSRRDGGSIGSGYYTPPSERAMQTYENGGYMAMGGDLQVHQGKAETISYNPFLPNGGETVMFKGPSHAEGGMDISYGQNGVEVEGGEPGVVLKDGGEVKKDESLVIYGNIKFDKTGAEQLGDPKAKGQKIKNYMNDLSKFENKQNNLIEKSLKLIDEDDPLRMGTVQAIKLGTTMNLKTAAQRKIDGAAIQEAYNKTAKEYGYKDAGKFIDDVRKGSVKKLKPIDDSETAQYGNSLPNGPLDGVIRPSRNAQPPLFARMLGAKASSEDPNNYNPQLLQQLMYNGNPNVTPIDEHPNNYNAQLLQQLLGQSLYEGPSQAATVTPFTRKNTMTQAFKDSNKSNASSKATSSKTTSTSKQKVQSSVSVDATDALNAMTAKGKELAQIRRDAIGTYGQVPGAMSLPNSASVVPLNSTDSTAKNDRWKDILRAVSSVVPMLRPSNAQPLDPSQLSGEMLALASNQLEGVQAQSFQPMLDQPFDISLQDQINMIDSQSNAAIRALGNDPSAQSQIMANAIEAKNRVLGEEFRMNQANKAGIYSKNRDLINQSKLANLQIFDKQYERQSQAKSNTKAQAIGALNSINSKIAQNKLENKQLGVYENLYGYRFGPNGQAYNLNGLAQFNMSGNPFARTNNSFGQLEEGLEDTYNSAGRRIGTRKKGKDETSRNGSIVKALKSL